MGLGTVWEMPDSESGAAGRMAGAVRERVEQFVQSTPRGGPAVVGFVRVSLFLVTLLNFFRELRRFGFDWPQGIDLSQRARATLSRPTCPTT